MASNKNWLQDPVADSLLVLSLYFFQRNIITEMHTGMCLVAERFVERLPTTAQMNRIRRCF